MKSSHRSILFTLIAAGAALAFAAPAAMAQHSHDPKPAAPGDKPQPGHKDDGHGHAPAKAADSYAAAMKEIGERMTALDGLIAKGDLDEAHEQSDAIGALAKSLGALALKDGSGVERAKVKEINKAGKALAEAADGVHEAGEKKDAAAAKTAYAEMKKQAEALTAFAPAKYFCPMHCEGAKTYDKPGTCPVCNMNLKKQTSDKFMVDVKPVGGTIVKGKPATLVFTIKDPTGLAVKKVELVHEKLLHLLMVSKDLSWYAHEHPVIQADGTFTFTYTFPAAGEFYFYNDFTPPSVGQQVVIVPVTVEGVAPAAKPLAVDAGTPKTIDGYTVSLDTGGPVKTGAATHMVYTVTKDGKPVSDLQPYLGAMGHLVIISSDLREFVHSHPHEGGEHAAGAHDDKGKGEHGHAGDKKGGPKVDFEAHFKAAGVYKGWAQFQHMGKVITVPMTFNVAKGEASDAGHDKKEGGHDHK